MSITRPKTHMWLVKTVSVYAADGILQVVFFIGWMILLLKKRLIIHSSFS